MKLRKKTYVLLIILIIFQILLPLHCFAYDPDVGANAAILIELSSGKILYEKNSSEILYPASLTKVMTAILTLENCKLDDKVIVSESAVSGIGDGYVTADIFVKEELTVKDLLYTLMIKSANDVANVLAEHISRKCRTIF